jgi:2-methylcitrate dehydratase PrpD
MEKTAIPMTKRLAGFIAGYNAGGITPLVYEHAKVAFLDWLGVTLGGKEDPLVKKLIGYSDLMGGNEQATILGYGVKKSLEHAALINGSASHALDFDDTLEASLGHPSVTLFPSLLALAEWQGRSGIDFLTAYVIGLKAAAVIGTCAGLPHYMSGSHATATIGHLASAAACARLLELDEQQTVFALGIAGTQAAGLKRVFGTMCKPFHAGRASQAGLTAALLAKEGFTSAEDILEGPHGFFAVLKGEVKEAVLESLGKTWDIERLAQKYHASCHATHSPIEAVMWLMETHRIKPRDLREIKVFVSQLALDAAGKLAPTSGLEGKFSIPYCVVNAILRGDTGMTAFTDEKVRDAEVAEYMKRVKLELDDGLGSLEARVVLVGNGGEEYVKTWNILKDIPDLETKRIKIGDKFSDLCRAVLGDTKTRKLRDQVLSLEKLDAMPKIIEQI